MYIHGLSAPTFDQSLTISASKSPCFYRKQSNLSVSYLMKSLKMSNVCGVKRVFMSNLDAELLILPKRSKSSLIPRNYSNANEVICDWGFEEEKDDEYYMRRCVELARKAIGCTSPNPMVGCVIVKNGNIVGEGFHPKAGKPHAEVFALHDAGVLAENATAYVSLEPCNHYGRTPPCTEALIAAKIKHVVVGMVDPNPIVASKGVERLREAGIEVTVGVEEELCRKLNEAYIYRILTGKPFVTLRYSLSFDGRILNYVAEGGEETRGHYLQMLQDHDGVIMSSTTMAKNTEFLASFNKLDKQPLLIILATASEFPLSLPTLTEKLAPHAIIFAEKSVLVDRKTELDLRRCGTEIVYLDKMDLTPVLDYCGHRGLCSVLMDLKGDNGDFHRVLEMGLEKGHVQKVMMEVPPVWAGTEEGSLVGLSSPQRKPMKLRDLQSRRLKEGSVLVEGYLC